MLYSVREAIKAFLAVYSWAVLALQIVWKTIFASTIIAAFTNVQAFCTVWVPTVVTCLLTLLAHEIIPTPCTSSTIGFFDTVSTVMLFTIIAKP